MHGEVVSKELVHLILKIHPLHHELIFLIMNA